MARQKMLTAEIIKKTPALYAQDGKGQEAIAYAKFFNPCGSHTWYMSEYDPTEGRAFGKVVSQMCPEGELGYFSIPELQAIKLQFGLYIERDLHFKPKPLKDCK